MIKLEFLPGFLRDDDEEEFTEFHRNDGKGNGAERIERVIDKRADKNRRQRDDDIEQHPVEVIFPFDVR
jgi:hypothetical protein